MLVAQSLFSHIRQFDCALRARVAKQVARYRVELGSRDDFCQLLHVDGFDIENVCSESTLVSLRYIAHAWTSTGRTETLVADVEVPQIDSQVISAHVCLSIAVDTDRVDVVCMCVGVNLAGHCCHDRVVIGHSWQPEIRRAVGGCTSRG